MAARASLVSASSPSCRVPFLNQRLNCIHRIVCRAIVLFNLIPFDFKIIADQNRPRLGYAETRSSRLPALVDHLPVDNDHIVGRTAR